MKKFFMMLALASVSVAGMAQTSDVPEMKHSVATNSFWSNWFISANLSYSAWYSNEEKGNDFKKGVFEDFRRNLGASVAIGKWFTPGIGLRTKVNGIWGRNVLTEDASKNAFKYWNAQEQVMFNLSNLFCGYKESRVWNLIPYAGTGILRNCSDNEYAHAYSIGLLNTWKLSKNWAVNFDLGFNISDDEISAAGQTNHEDYGVSIPSTDRYFTAELGLTYNLGKATWNKTPDVDALKALSQSQIDALNAQLADEEAENARLKKMLADHKCPEAKTVTVKEVTAAPVSVFFNIGKSKIASRKDLQNVQELANVAKDKDAKIVVTGYADSKTGSANFNQKLSEKRAETVKAELVKMGVKEANIETVAAGGVDTLSPVSYNRRATVEIK
jgi:outer membrane protein OmpA-like peptidoglycan-associated protein